MPKRSAKSTSSSHRPSIGTRCKPNCRCGNYGESLPCAWPLSMAPRCDFGNANGDAGWLGSIERVTAERHGAIRVGSPNICAGRPNPRRLRDACGRCLRPAGCLQQLSPRRLGRWPRRTGRPTRTRPPCCQPARMRSPRRQFLLALVSRADGNDRRRLLDRLTDVLARIASIHCQARSQAQEASVVE
jgi:hypothetical protein